jgi:hypothetical protein
MTGNLDPDTDSAVDFLARWAPGRRFFPSAIEPGGLIESRTFRDRQAAKEWIDGWQGKRNIYLSVSRAAIKLLLTKHPTCSTHNHARRRTAIKRAADRLTIIG